MSVTFFGKSDRGCTRDENEDRILVDGTLGLFAVCDGMGGHQHGEIAAELAISALLYYAEASRDGAAVSWPFGYNFEMSVEANRLATAIRVANRQVWRRSEQHLECAGMGTTIAAVLVTESKLVAGNIGDSRIYLFRDGQLQLLSTDDTIISIMLKRGMLSQEDIANHPMKNVLTQAAGSQENVEVHLAQCPLEPNDIILLSSDGLHSVVEQGVIQSILGSERTAPESVDSLISAALAAGGPDNVSTIVVRYS